MSEDWSDLESPSQQPSTDLPPAVRPLRSRFAPQSRLRFFSSLENHSDCSAVYPVEKVELKLQKFLRQAAPKEGHGIPRPGLNLIACHSSARDLIVDITEDHFLFIDEHDIALSKLELFDEKGQFGYHVKQEGNPFNGACILHIWWSTPAAFVHEISCVVRIDLKHGSTAIIYFDRNEDRMEDLIRRAQKISECVDLAPFNFCLELLSEYANGSESWRLLIDGRMRIMEDETGARSQRLELEPEKSHSFNFGRLTMAMQNSNISLVSLEHVVNWELMAHESFVVLWELYLQLLGELPSPRSMAVQARRDTQYSIENQLKAVQLRKLRVIGGQKRMQSQISILLSLISQRDNRVNIQLAQESREIAVAAKRDSKVMRIIAVLTLFFLPATLIASIFSSGIINLGDVADNAASRISPLWWIYAVSSLVSTGAVMFGGFLFLRNGSSTHTGMQRVTTWGFG